MPGVNKIGLSSEFLTTFLKPRFSIKETSLKFKTSGRMASFFKDGSWLVKHISSNSIYLRIDR